jgi:hypothetical protein
MTTTRTDHPDTPLTARDRFIRSLRGDTRDHVTDLEFRYWTEVPGLWHAQGLPATVNSDEEIELYFGLDRRWRPPVNTILDPPFVTQDVAIKDGNRIFYDTDHVLCSVPTESGTTMPRHLEYPLTSRRDWEQTFLPRLDHDSPGRFPDDLRVQVETALARGYVPWLYVGSLFGLLRNYMGFEAICYMVHDDPVLLDTMIERLADLTCAVLERALPKIAGLVDVAHFWEDICFNSGPMVSPDFFRKHLTPRYRQITETLARFGITEVIVDCDGFIEPLVPHWLDGGVNVFFPLERASGSDPVALRRKFGDAARLMGGIDKRLISLSVDPLLHELDRLAPLVDAGGYIPFCDHFVPPDVTLSAYRYYLSAKRDIFGIPERSERYRSYPLDGI